MSKYTTELRFICEAHLTQSSTGYNGIKEIIKNSCSVIFPFDFPIFDEAYRIPLETKIIRHFYTREICEETFGLWLLRLEDKMNMIMPYYNQLYESETLEFNPLWDVDVKTDRTKTNDSSAEGNLQSTSDKINDSWTTDDTTTDYNGKKNETYTPKGLKTTQSGTDNTTNTRTYSGTETDGTDHWDLYSDTPQGGVNGMTGNVPGGQLGDNMYLTNARHIVGTDKSKSFDDRQDADTGHITYGKTITESGSAETVTNTQDKTVKDRDIHATGEETGNRNEQSSKEISDVEDYFQHIYGKRGGYTYGKMLQDYRDVMLNIDSMIINELDDLFIGLW